jgi:uncharacterized membrane protein
MGKHPRWTAAHFTEEDLDAIVAAVASAEAETSAEIRVHLERRLPRSIIRGRRDPLARAREVFAVLGMHRTAERHGVLIYLALADRRLAIVGDEGIHARVGPEYWARVRDLMVERLRSQAPREAVVAAVREVGEALRANFPRRPDDTNELSDEVSIA